MLSFDLTSEPWIRVMAGGLVEEVGLRDAITRAHEYDGLAVDRPLEAVAILRLLEAILLDVYGVPRTEDVWESHWLARRFDADTVEAYLTEHAGRFDLFHSVAPFAQVAGLHTAKNETKPVSLLLPAAATGNNVPLFASRTEAEPPALTPAEAARALLVAHAFDTAAIKSGAVGDPRVKGGKTTGNPTGPLGQLGVVIPIGRNLHQTLVLNLPIVPSGPRPRDLPHWRRPPATPVWQERPAFGLCDLLTWQARRIKLFPEETADGTIVVRHVVVAAGDRLTDLPVALEPHTMWKAVPKPKPGQPATRPVRHQPGRSAWRGMDALVAVSAPTDDKVRTTNLLEQLARLDGVLPADLGLQVLVVGVQYGNQSAVVEDVVADQVPLPVLALMAEGPVRDLVLEVVHDAEHLRVAANHLGDELREACNALKIPWDKGQRLGDTLVHEFTPFVHRLLAGLQVHPDQVAEASAAWRQVARRLAWEAGETALDAAPPGAFTGRVVDKDKGWRRCVATAEVHYRSQIVNTLGPADPGTSQREES